MAFNLIGFLLGNWRIIATVLALAAILYRIDDRAYHSGVDYAFETCQNATVPAARAWEQSECLKNIQRIEDSNVENTRNKNAIIDRHALSLKRLRAEAGKHAASASSQMDEGSSDRVQFSGEGGSLGERILELSKDAATRDEEYLGCRKFVLDVSGE
jgi:hypothetical protein